MIDKCAARRQRLVKIAIAVGVTVAFATTACSSSGGGSPTGGGASSATQSDIAAALQKDTTITFWGWAPQTKDVVAAFEKAYPKVKVKLLNVGSNATEYTKLQNVIKASSGIPDVAQLEYMVLPQFALGKSLVDLNKYGVSSIADKFTKSTWSQAHVGDALYGMPQDSGPLAMFYRQDVFAQYGLTVPKTWDEYLADAKKLHTADPSKFIAADSGDASFTNSMIWQAGGTPYTVSGSKISVNLGDKGSTKWADMWSQLVHAGLVDTKAAIWSPDWLSGLANGKYATWIAGGWGAGSLINHVPTASGKWRVAPIPQYSADVTASAEHGGSTMAVLTASNNKLAAIGFAQWFSTNPGANKIWVEEGGFPSQTGVLESSGWINKPVSYFGDQEINKVFKDSSKAVLPGWQYLPFTLYANSIYGDTVGRAFANKSGIASGLAAWQRTIISYGNGQGFTVK
jgi:multiple sugar transport system substrate-binding protein